MNIATNSQLKNQHQPIAQWLLIVMIMVSSGFVVAEEPHTKTTTASQCETDLPCIPDMPVQMFPIQSQQQSLSMAYRYLPSANKQPTVVLLHGKNFNGDYLIPTARALHKLGYGVLLPDQVGFGRSTMPGGYQYSFEALANNTHNLIDHLGIQQPVILGHSMGGMLAMRFGLMFPNTTAALILINPLGLEDYLKYETYQDVDTFYAQELNKTIDSAKRYMQHNYFDDTWKSTYNSSLDLLRSQLKSGDWPRIAWNNALTYDMIFTGPVIYEIDQLPMPVWLVIGDRDKTAPGKPWQKKGSQYQLGNFPVLGKKAVARLPNGKLEMMENIGHVPMLENAREFKTVLRKILQQIKR